MGAVRLPRYKMHMDNMSVKRVCQLELPFSQFGRLYFLLMSLWRKLWLFDSFV